MSNEKLSMHNNFEKEFYNHVYDNRFGYANKTHIELRKFAESFCFSQNKKFNKVLEIGCGSGEYCMIASKYASQVIGIDLSENALKMAEKLKNQTKIHNIKFEHISFEEFNETGFDLILLPNVISCVHNLNIFFEKIVKILNKDGLIFIQNRNKNALIFKIQKILGKDFKNKAELHFFDIKDFHNFLEKNGFSITKYDAKIFGPIEFLENRNFLFKLLFKLVFNMGSLFKRYANYIYLLARKNDS